jgi:lipopolysaccharide biosynthesis glycosyltransferase
MEVQGNRETRPRPDGAAENEFALVFATDEDFALALAVAIRSTLAHLAPTVTPEIYIFDSNISAASRTRLEKIVAAAGRHGDLRWITISPQRVEHLSNPYERITVATYSRLLIPELVARHVRRVVYLDVDVLVRQDLSPLFAIDLGGAPVGAVRDFVEHRHLFNAGVLVIDVERWRSDGLAERALQLAAETGESDQEALNTVVQSWCELEYKWNVQHGNLFFAGLHGLAERPPATDVIERLYVQRWQLYRNAAILHFVGGVKPWERPCPLPGTTAWVRTMIRTRWYPPGEMARWVFRYVGSRIRYWLGTMRIQLRGLLSSRGHRSSGGDTANR